MSSGQTREPELRDPLLPVFRYVAIPLVHVWFRWRFEGLRRIPPEGPALVACNHLSYFDPIANTYALLKAGRRPRYLAKEELFRVPVFGSIMRAHGQIPVQRGTRDRSSLDRAHAALRGGEVVVVYPEGTVTKHPEHLPMAGKTGVVRLALDCGLPVIPMASWGSAPIWQKSGRGSIRPGRPIWTKVGEPIELADRADARSDHATLQELTAEVMRALTALVEDLRARYPRGWSDG